MPVSGYFDTIFAVDGDLTAVPDPTQGSGAVSYQQGYGILYSTAVGSGGLNFPRAQNNQLLYDITSAIQAIQQTGVPPYFSYISSNGGYVKYARVLYTDGHIYQSLISANTVTPANDGVNWTIFDASTQRIKLTGSITYYIATTGNDSTGNGTSGAPWATIQHAINYIAKGIDLAGFSATIQLADGTYTIPITNSIPFIGGSYSSVIINGDSVTPANVIINTTSASAFVATTSGSGFTIQNLKIETTTSGNCIESDQGAVILIGAGVIFGSCAAQHIETTNDGIVLAQASYTISGSALYHMAASSGNIGIETGVTVTVSGAPTFTAFAEVSVGGQISATGVTYTGSATGQRYNASLNGVINTSGAGANLFPGSTAGATSSGGQYA